MYKEKLTNLLNDRNNNFQARDIKILIFVPYSIDLGVRMPLK